MAKSSDLEANDCEDDTSKSASIFGNSWPFIDPGQIKLRKIATKRVRRRRKKVRWTVKRQKKPRDVHPKIDSATASLSTKRSTSSSLQGSKRENLSVSRDRSARLSVRKNPSSTRSRVFVGDEDERLSESYGEDDDDKEEVISQTTSESSSEEIAPVDYSGSGYSRFYSTSHTKEEPQNRTELSEYPDYFMNVLRMDNSTENNYLDTSEDDTSRNNVQTAKFAKFAERQTSRKIIENGNTTSRTRKISLEKRKFELRNRDKRAKVLKKRRKGTIRQKEKTRNSAEYNHYNRRRISHDLEENSTKSKSDLKDDVATGTRDVAKEIAVQKRCDCKAGRRSHNFTNTACPCKRNSKNTAAAIMRDIQECIKMKIENNVENIETISKIEKNMPEDIKDPSLKDLSQDISMEYDWVDNDDQNLSSRILERSFDPRTNVEEKSSKSINSTSRRRKRRYESSIDCKFDESTETAYRSVFHDCIDFDTPQSTPSLKINIQENWRSAEDSSDNDDEIHSWRRSTLGSSTEECGNEVDGALLLARKIVSDDSTKDEKCDDEHETLNNACYKNHEMSDIFTMSRKNSCNDSDENMEDLIFANQRDDVITYRNKNRTFNKSIDSFKDEGDFKVSLLLYIHLLYIQLYS